MLRPTGKPDQSPAEYIDMRSNDARRNRHRARSRQHAPHDGHMAPANRLAHLGTRHAARAAAWRHRELDALDAQHRDARARLHGGGSGHSGLGRIRRARSRRSPPRASPRRCSHGLDQIIGPETHFAHRRLFDGRTDRGLSSRSMPARARDTLVLVGATGTGAPRAPNGAAEVVAAAADRRREARQAHRENLGILMIHDPQQHRRARGLHAVAQRRPCRASAASTSPTPARSRNCLPGFTGRLAGIWGEHDATAVPYLAERREQAAVIPARRARSTSSRAPATGCSTRRMRQSTGG